LRVNVSQFAGNPFLVFGTRPVREQRIRAHIVVEHRSGRPIAMIMRDRYIRRLSGGSLAWKGIREPQDDPGAR
jgi:hypothetical protein